jgi:multiple sugar transport system permease protein
MAAIGRREKLRIAPRATLLLFAIWTLFPIYWLVSMSLKQEVDVVSRRPTFIFTPTFQNYFKVLTDPAVLGFLKNSLIVGLGTTLVGLLLGVPAAYVLARFEFRGSRDLGFWVLSTRFTPPIAMLIPYFVIFYKAGLLDTHLGLIIAHLGTNLSMIVWLMRGFFRDLPRELQDAAQMDGASRWQTFYWIMLPIARPGIAAAAILTFLFSWNEFLFSLVLGGSSVTTIPVGLYKFIGYQQIDWGKLSAGAVIMIAPVILFVLLVQRQLIRGLTFGAVK